MVRRLVALQCLALLVALPLLTVSGCSDDGPSKPAGEEARHLAGGGRGQGDDPFAGGPADSGPTRPGFEYPEPGYVPLFYSESDCRQAPGLEVIRDQETFQAWWSGAIACLGWTDPGDPTDPDDPVDPGTPGIGRLVRERLRLGRIPAGIARGDSGVVEPDTLFPYPDEAPLVDFQSNVVLTISLEPDTALGRGVWVTDVSGDAAGAVVRYQVSRLGEGCYRDPATGVDQAISSPTIAVLAPGPVTDPVRWEREDIVFDCGWEPDPDTPITLYYTDADCDLGAGETVIRDGDRFDAWVSQALDCDQIRWIDADSTLIPGEGPRPGFGPAGGDRDSIPGDPPAPPPSWIGIDVDFSVYAVLILRAGPQTRWGGGIWLDRIETTANGTVIEYSVMQPGADCPEITEGVILQPTVAIRVPLPLTEPVMWQRRTETIPCGWAGNPEPGTGSDSTGVVPPPGIRPPGR